MENNKFEIEKKVNKGINYFEKNKYFEAIQIFNELKDNIWKELCSLKDISISIDLFQFGILLVDKKISKQHFVVKMR